MEEVAYERPLLPDSKEMSYRSIHQPAMQPTAAEDLTGPSATGFTGPSAGPDRTGAMRDEHALQSGLSAVRNNQTRLHIGDSGAQVEWLQNKLKQLGLYDGPVNGEFDRGLAEAVRRFQLNNTITRPDGSTVQLLGDGVVGARTMRALDLAVGAETLALPDFERVIGGDWIGYGLGLPEKRRSHHQADSSRRPALPARQESYVDQYSVETRRTEEIPPELASAISRTAHKLGAREADLVAVIAFETGGTFRPDIQNSKTGATGLIQFMPQTARELGTSTGELAGMSAVEQMQYVERYFEPYRGRLKDSQDLYAAVLWPRAVGKDGQYPLFAKGSQAYAQNSGLDADRDGTVTKKEAAEKALRRRV